MITNEKFLLRMKEMLPDEYDAFIAGTREKRKRSLRINNLKCSGNIPESFISGKSPFAPNGWYLNDEAKGLTTSYEYLTGLIYLQEPSASGTVTVMAPEKGMNILDLCAAPGSKTTQIAEYLENTGFILANDINFQRANVLCENVERSGSANCYVTNNSSHVIASACEDFFDMVLCDAPCSGEGLLKRKKEEDIAWSEKVVLACARRQSDILDDAYKCLKPGGTLVYSTCTFSLEENEENIAAFLTKHPDMKMIPADVSFGRKGFDKGFNTSYAVRIFPMDGGEGHFIAKMRKDGRGFVNYGTYDDYKPKDEAEDILHELLDRNYPHYFLRNGCLYGGVAPFYRFDHIKLIRPQVFLGTISDGRFIPSHHLFSSSYTGFKKKVELDEYNMKKYLRGEEIPLALPRGYTAVSFNGIVLGGAKSDGRCLKNMFPKHLRIK